MAEYHACESRNTFPGEIVLSEDSYRIRTCQENIDIDYKESDLHNYQLLDILRGRKMTQLNGFRQLNSNKNSRIIIIITSHGGENFIKVRGNMVILSTELHRTLNEMYIKDKYKELLFVLDTCEGYSLFDDVRVPNIYFIASSLVNQKASSYSFDHYLMGPTVDKFHFLLYNNLKEIHSKGKYNMSLDDLFNLIKSKKEFLSTDVTVRNNVNRTLYVSEFFGDNRIKDSPNHYIKYNINNDLNVTESNINEHRRMGEIRDKMDEHVINLRTFHSDKYKLEHHETEKFSQNLLATLGLVLIVGIIFENKLI